MKVVAKPIEVVAWFDKIGTVHPFRFRIMQNETITTVIIDKIIRHSRKKLVGIKTIIFTCQSLINNIEKIYEIKYKLISNLWILYKD